MFKEQRFIYNLLTGVTNVVSKLKTIPLKNPITQQSSVYPKKSGEPLTITPSLYPKKSGDPPVIKPLYSTIPVDISPAPGDKPLLPYKGDSLIKKNVPQTIEEAVNATIQGKTGISEGLTTEERARQQYEGTYLTAAENYEKIFKKPAPFNTEQGYLDWRANASQSDLDYLEKQQSIQRELEASQSKTAIDQMTGAEKSVTANMAQSREGAMTSTKQMFVSEFKTQMDTQKKQIELNRTSAESQRQKAYEDLKNAQEQGNMELANAISGKIASIEQNIQQIDNQSMQLALQANEQALQAEASTRANITTYTDLVNNGTELSTEAIMGFSQSLGVDFGIAYEYYKGAEIIRNDKTLGVQEKELALQQNKQNLEDQINRVNTTAATNVEYLKNLYSSGASEDVISAFKNAAGITDTNDPMYQAELGIKSAQAQLAALEAANYGKPPAEGTMERLQYDMLKLEVQAAQMELGELSGSGSNGNVQGSQVSAGIQQEINNIPSSGSRSTNALGSGVITGYGSKYWKAGLDFVIDGGMDAPVPSPVSGEVMQVDTGHKKGEKNSFGNRVKIKMDNGDEVWLSHLNTTNVQVGQIISAGTIVGGQGNTGSVYGATGIHVDATIKKSGGGYYTAKEVQAFLQSAKKIQDSAPTTALKGLDEIVNNLKPFAGTVAGGKEIEENLKGYAQSGDLKAMQDYVTTTVFNSLGATESAKMTTNNNIVAVGEDLKKDIEEYSSIGGDMGIFSGTYTDVNNKIGKITNSKQQELALKMRYNLEIFARSQTGAAIQDFERVEFGKILPTIYDGKDLALSKIDTFAQIQKTIADNTLKQKIGETAYNSLFPESLDKDISTLPKNKIDQYTKDIMGAATIQEKQEVINKYRELAEVNSTWSSSSQYSQDFDDSEISEIESLW